MDKKLPLERHFSAGGIIIRDRKILVTQHSGHKGWSFPKGMIEKGEKSEETALREVKEETGVEAKILEKLGQTQYIFVQEGKKIFKTITWFLMEFLEEGEASHGWEVSSKVWLKPDEILGKLTFESDKKFFKENFDKICQITDAR